MNFKFGWGKVIFSLIIGLFGGAEWNYDVTNYPTFHPAFFIWTIIIFIIIYTIWSLFQKKK